MRSGPFGGLEEACLEQALSQRVTVSDMGEAQGFWSYTHADDDAEGGRITQLARDVVAQFELLTAETIRVFLDRDELEWGDDWRPKIDGGLSSVAFFIPVVTPRYFISPECRRELNFFARRAERLGINELVLPLLYVRVPQLDDESPTDELVTLVKRFQWVDWTSARFADRASTEYRSLVAALAERLARASSQVEGRDVAAALEAAARSEGDDDDAPGVLDKVAAAETAMPEFTATLGEITSVIDDVGSLMVEGRAWLDEAEARGAKLAGRLRVLRDVSRELSPKAERIVELGQTFTAQLHDLDVGMRTVIELGAEEASKGPEKREQVCAFFHQVKGMAGASRQGLGSVQGMVDSITPIEGLSRDLRPPLRTMRQGLALMVEGQAVINEWEGLVDASGIDCEPPGNAAAP